MDLKFGFFKHSEFVFNYLHFIRKFKKWPLRPGDDAQRPPPLLHHLITNQVVHARPSGNHQRESAQLSPPPITTDASSKRPTTDSKDHDRRVTIVSCYAGDTLMWPLGKRVGWTSLDGRASWLIGFEYRQTNMKCLGKIANVIVTRWLHK